MKQPPILPGEEFYIKWIQGLQVWTLYTELLMKKQGSAVFLSLSQNIC